MAVKTPGRKPGRPRIHPSPVKLGIRFRPSLFARMDRWLKGEEPDTTQRAFIERSVESELDQCEANGPPPNTTLEGDQHHEHPDTNSSAATVDD
jgi:hypothetical protein